MNMPPRPPSIGSDTPPDPRYAPLDADEAVLADAMRTLPTASPSAALDARVLAMAKSAITTDAAHPARPVRSTARGARRPRGLWWLGTAAGAVMAAGIGWQLGGFSGHENMALQPGAATSARVEPTSIRARQSVETEFVIIPRAAPPADVVPAQRSAVQTAANTSGAATARAAEPAPLGAAAPAERRESTTPQPLAEAIAMPAPVVSPPATMAAAPRAPGGADELSAADAGTAGSEAERPSLDQIVVTGSRLSNPSGTGPFPHVAQDFRLPPEEWLQRIRDRRDSGDVESARRSLREFVRANPQRVIPKDIRPLLNDSP